MDENTPENRSTHKKTQGASKHPAPIFRRFSVYGFLALIMLPAMLLLSLVCFDVLRHLYDIETVAAATNTKHLPGILASQRALINIENLRRYAETAFISADPSARREAEVNALALSSESVFEPDSRFNQYAGTVTKLIRKLVAAKNRSDKAADQLHKSELELARILGRLTLQSDLDGKITLRHNARHLSSPREKKRNEELYDEAAALLTPLHALCREADAAKNAPLVSDCQAFQYSWKAVEKAWRTHDEIEQEARDLWQELDEQLRELSDLASSVEAELTYQAMEHISAEAQKMQLTFYLSCFLLASILAVVAFALHRFILAPLALASRNLRRIRYGLTAEPVAPVRIRELQDILDLLPGISAHVAALAARSGKLEQEKTKYATLSLADGLTGVNNRRSFDTELAASDPRHSLALLMLDVDMFKRYNDNYGHQAGDKALIEVAHTVEKALLRSTDHVFRYGGEEFTIMLVDASEESALSIANRVLLHVRALQIPHETSPVAPILTVSIGVALREANEPISDATLLARSDHALYQAKSSGRNRISLYMDGEGDQTRNSAEWEKNSPFETPNAVPCLKPDTLPGALPDPTARKVAPEVCLDAASTASPDETPEEASGDASGDGTGETPDVAPDTTTAGAK